MPGLPSVKHSLNRLTNPFWTRYRKTRDLILFDQRGTGFSDPEFCSELDFIHQTISFRGLSTNEQRALLIEAVANCRQSMLAKGIDFAFYNSTTSARDLDDLRSVLGYNSWNLFGVSYGTRLALTAMRDYPSGIRSVIIDSNWPPNAPLGDDIVDGNLLAAGVFSGLYDRNFDGMLPLMVRELSGRNADVLTALADGLLKEPGMSSGLYLAIACVSFIVWVLKLGLI